MYEIIEQFRDLKFKSIFDSHERATRMDIEVWQVNEIIGVGVTVTGHEGWAKHWIVSESGIINENSFPAPYVRKLVDRTGFENVYSDETRNSGT